MALNDLSEASSCDVDAQDEDGRTALHVAVAMVSKEDIKLLLDRGARVNMVDNNGDTPLHCVISCLNSSKLLSYAMPIMDLLLEKGADLDAQNNIGCTPLHCAVKVGNYWMVKHLVTEGATIDVADHQGKTPYNYLLKPDLRSGSVNNTDYLGSLRSYEKIMIFVKKHIILLRTAGLKVNISNVDFKGFESFETNCSNEIERIKKRKYGSQCLYDLFSPVGDPFYVTNNLIEQAIKAPSLESEFPIYCSLIKVSFLKAKKRYNLLNVAQKDFRVQLPNEIKRNILSYINNKDLKSVISIAAGPGKEVDSGRKSNITLTNKGKKRKRNDNV